MKVEASFLRSARFIVVMSVFMGLGLAFVGVNAWPAKKPLQTTRQIQVRNYTKALEVVGTETVGEMYVISLKNVSAKAISAYTWSLGPTNRPTYSYDTDGAISGQVISPGAVHRERISLAAFDRSAESTAAGLAIINFVAVLFDDRNAEGLPEDVRVLKDRRFGQRIQLQRIRTLLAAATSEGLKSPSALGNLRTSISVLSERVDGDESDEVRDGLLSAKRHVLVMLDHLTKEHGASEMLRGPDSSEGVRRVLSSLMEQTDSWLLRY